MNLRVNVFVVLTLLSALHAQELSFNRDVRPILSDKCFGCHGPDARTRAITPAQVVPRITASNAATRMPPVSSGLKLSEREIGVLRDWVAQGARWEKHWSFIPPQRPSGAGIDHFVRARVEREGLKPSPE